MYSKLIKRRTQSKHNDQDDKHIGINQFFTLQNFPDPDSLKFSTIKILHHTISATSVQNIHKKTFAVRLKICKKPESFPLKCFVVYGIFLQKAVIIMLNKNT